MIQHAASHSRFIISQNKSGKIRLLKRGKPITHSGVRSIVEEVSFQPKPVDFVFSEIPVSSSVGRKHKSIGKGYLPISIGRLGWVTIITVVQQDYIRTKLAIN